MTVESQSLAPDAVPGPKSPGEGRPARRRSRVTVVLLPLLLVGIVALIASTMRAGQGALVYSKYVDEVMATPDRYVGQDLRVEGTVTEGSIANTPGSRDFRFRIERNQRTLPVHYVGVVPDTFREGIGVTVRGRLGADGLFEAREVVAKCPSKYEMQSARAAGSAMPHALPSGAAMPAGAASGAALPR